MGLISRSYTRAAHRYLCHRCSDRSSDSLQGRCVVLWASLRAYCRLPSLGGKRESRVDPARNEKSCRALGNHFFEAVEARQAASICDDGIDHQRALDVLDAFNNLIGRP